MSGKQACPCGSSSFDACCARFIRDGAYPDAAEQLMRSRYSAYVLRDDDYLRASWHPDTVPDGPITTNDDGVKWLGLDVRRAQQQGDDATVEFVARYKVAGRAHRLHEISRFVRADGRWFYVDGSFPEKQA